MPSIHFQPILTSLAKTFRFWTFEKYEDASQLVYDLDDSPGSQEADRRLNLINAIYRLDSDSHAQGEIQAQTAAYTSWFIHLLEAGFDTLPREYKGLGMPAATETAMSKADFFDIVVTLCSEIGHRREATLGELAESLMEKGLVTRDTEQSERVQQFIFAVIGLASTLFTPGSSFSEGALTMDIPTASSGRRRISETWAVSEQPLKDAPASIVDIIRAFSDGRGPIRHISGASTQLLEVNTLYSRNLNYYVLSQIAGMSIRWVDSVAMHLEMNRREKTLMIFRYPSICALLSQGLNQQIYLDQLFKDYSAASGCELDRPTPAGDFYRELLQMYRLIFGQNKRSWSLCKSHRIVPRHGNVRAGHPGAARVDPLLYRLCCRSWENDPIFDEIDAPEVRSLYSAQHDFPYFGERLVALQEYTRLLEPDDWRTLYYDRRDVNRFCATWAVIFFGVVSLTLAILGVALAAAQIATSLRNDGT